jgi:DNA-binding MarR family transcriptional regulator
MISRDATVSEADMSKAESVTDEFKRIEAELYQYLTYRLSRVQAKLNTQATHMLREASGITLSQWRIIALVGAAGETRLSMLARHSALDKGLLSRNLKALVSKGIVLTKQDQTDHRAQLLSLSPKGKEIFQRTLPVSQKRQSLLNETLTKDELETFHRVLEKLELAADARITRDAPKDTKK